MFSSKNVRVVDSAKDWQESIEIAARPLIELGKIEERYITSMIESIKKLGFYVVLAENLAMPHARPEDGVNETGVSFLKVNEGVFYGDDKIYLIFVLAAKDSNSHLETIEGLVDIFQDEDKINKLIQSKTQEDILKILN
ncbi:PTS sugar transporter subunit IIA [Pseudostreptobacillus hongkongensis]|uniref:PTS sugar transporter subunit IIA n=1 Tax=Pseudostreptobacillus hongkongensis TaxID=1162717 RepID=UPI0028D20DB0|nr:PTS sugar transporter subunit IIA [Pseudostreptobacillus hongkongensis]